MTHPESLRGTSRFDHYLRWRCVLQDPFLEADFNAAGLEEQHVSDFAPRLETALAAMRALEAGGIANPDEQRMVGHYWLRAPARAPQGEIAEAIVDTLRQIEEFAARVHGGSIAPPEGTGFTKVLLIGIGGSALGPMLLAAAFGHATAPMSLHVLDNTDPEGIDQVLEQIGSLQDTLVLVVSKSGGTPETRNGMLEVQEACREQGLELPPRAVAVTGKDSALERRARAEGWLAVLPMWDWIGGRTSIFAAVGLLPGALLGMDVRAFLAGAAAMDELTRSQDPHHNPAALMAMLWHVQGEGRGAKDMVVLPYKDRLLLFSRYLQQLVMESLGKKHDRDGNVVHQGLSVFGNKGSTDQHAYVQQLRDGIANFFVAFVRVLADRPRASIAVDDDATSGDYLDGFWQGTRRALAEESRSSVTITLERLDERSLGALIALFERTVGLYAELVNVNAYDQPGVEAGKKAAAAVLTLQRRVLGALQQEPRTCLEIAKTLDVDAADVWPILRHLAANRPGVRMIGTPEPRGARFRRA